MSQLILIDGDILTYRIAYSVETPIYICKGGIYKRKGYAEFMAKKFKEEGKGEFKVFKRVNVGSVPELKQKLKKLLDNSFDDISSHHYEMYLTASKVENNYRSNIATIIKYKGNRTDLVKPIHYNRLREILVKEYGAILVDGQEADDSLAIRQTELFNQFGNWEHSIIWSVDKDLDTVPGYHYNPTSRLIYFVDEDKALKNFYTQILQGDFGTDNVPGLYNLLVLQERKEEAHKLKYSKYMSKFKEEIEALSPDETFSKVKEMFGQYGYGDKEINEIGNLLHLRRFPGQIWSDRE